MWDTESSGKAAHPPVADAEPVQEGPGRDGTVRNAPARARRAAWTAAIVAGILTLFWLYWLQARDEGVGSDAASNVLQGAAMLHGNLLLHGWVMTDVSFYCTELVQYALLQTVMAMSPGVVFVAGAMTYLLLLLAACWLAKGRATGRQAMIRVCAGAAVMLAPAPGAMLHAPAHLGSALPVLVVWLVIDRCPPRWYVPVAVCLLLTWGQVADPLVELTGVAAVALACGARSGLRLLRRRRGGGDHVPAGSPPWFEPALAAAAVMSAGLSQLALAAIRAAGGFTVPPLSGSFTGIAGVWEHAAITGKTLLALFGTAFWTETPAPLPWWQAGFSYVHLAVAALAAAGLVLALRRFFEPDALVTAGIAAGIVLNVAVFMTSRFPTDMASGREISAVLPFSVVLAGRLVPGFLAGRARLRGLRPAAALTALALVGVAMTAANSAVARPAPPAQATVAGWLSAHQAGDGLALSYWMSNVITVDTGGRVAVRPATVARGAVAQPAGWNSDTGWYDPAENSARFLLTDAPAGSGAWKAQLRAAEATFGRPARTYLVDGDTVWTWPGNILARLGPAPPK